MKKKLMAILAIFAIFIVVVTYLSINPRATVTAKIRNIYDSGITVDIIDEENPLSYVNVTITDDTKIYDSNGKRTTIGYLQYGDIIEIVYDGAITENFPSKINNCFKIMVE